MKYFLLLLMLTSCVHTPKVYITYGDYVKPTGFYTNCCVRVDENYLNDEGDVYYSGEMACLSHGEVFRRRVAFSESSSYSIVTKKDCPPIQGK